LTKEFTDALIFNKKQEFLHFNLLTSLDTLSAQYLCAFTIGRLTFQTSLKPPSDLPIFIKNNKDNKGTIMFWYFGKLAKMILYFSLAGLLN
jgi:hypothetical protein